MKILILLFIIFVCMGCYIINSLMLCKVAKNNNYERAWLSFIPLCREYLIFNLGEQEDFFKIYFFAYIVKYILFFSILKVGILYFYFPKTTMMAYRIMMIVVAISFCYGIYNLGKIFNVNKFLTYVYCLLTIFNGFFGCDFSIKNTTLSSTILLMIIEVLYYVKLYKNSINNNNF